MTPEYLDRLPKFQKLQHIFAAHIRDPENQPYEGEVVEGEAPIEPRRLKAYEELFYNNLLDFFSNLFPVLKSIVGDDRWREIVREYLQKHRSRTPLFHELGQEFILFLQNEYEPQESDPAYMLELAHYEWVELAVSIDEHECLDNEEDELIDLDAVYDLSPLAWPLAYEWPVHRLSTDNAELDKPEWMTTLLVYREHNDTVEFMELTPVLYELLQQLAQGEDKTLREQLTQLAETIQVPEEDVLGFATEILQNFIAGDLIGKRQA